MKICTETVERSDHILFAMLCFSTFLAHALAYTELTRKENKRKVSCLEFNLP
jgi:hypothetical protein